MSKSGGGVGGSTSKGRVSSKIPHNVRGTILNIKEIATNHSDDDIYAMLKECSMDPDETTQRLLFLDTFHEVKSKRDKRKENMKSRPVGESRGKPAYQWRGSRGARGTSYPQYSSYDHGERRNAAIQTENVAGESKGKGFRPSSVTMNGPMKVPNGGPSDGHEAQSSGVGDTNLLSEKIDADSNKSPVLPKGAADHSSHAGSQIPAAVGAITGEVQIQHISSESNESIPIDAAQGTVESISCSHLHKQGPHIVDEPRTSLPMTEKVTCEHSNVAQPKILDQCPPDEKVHPPGSVSVVRSCSSQGVEEATSKIEKLKFSDGQHVLIPSHIQVPDSVKNMLSFGSFGVREKQHSNSENNVESNSADAKVHDETTSKSSSCEEDAMPAVTDGKHVDQPQAPVHLVERNSPAEPDVSSSATIPKGEQMKEFNLPAVGPPFPVVQTAPSYSFGFMPPLLVDPLVKPEIVESQAHVLNSQAGGSPPMTTSPSASPPLQSAGAGQNSVAPPPSSIALFHQSYPPNYVPYSHYYPFYPPPAMHPYFGHTTFPMLPPGNMYLPPPGVAAGMKVSPAPYKPGANTGNQPPVGLPSGYGAYNSAQVTFSPSASVTSGNPIGSEDTVPSLLKENSTYLGQQSEGSTMWLPSAGRDATSFPLNAFVNLPSPAQHLINSQSGPTAFVYHALHPPMATPASALTPLQQSQPMTGSVGPHPSNVYQQPQSQQQANSNIEFQSKT